MKTNSQTERTTSYGESGLTIVDRIGVHLSKRAIQQQVRNKKDLFVLDIGCGYHATLLAALSQVIREGNGIDLKISEQAKSIKKLKFFEGEIESILHTLTKNQYDLILMISVLEHLWEPAEVLSHCCKALKPGGLLLINVPTWRGKFFLEYSAFKLKTSPACEMEDHKMYYQKEDLWPLLVKAGFKPSKIQLKYIKFGLNLFGRIQKAE